MDIDNTNDYFTQQENQKLYVPIPSLEIIKKELRIAGKILSNHKLLQSSKFANELYLGITDEKDINDSEFLCEYIKDNLDLNYNNKLLSEFQLNQIDEAEVELARTLFDLREFLKLSQLLEKFISSKIQFNQEALFLQLYSQYMAGEIKKDEEMIETDGNPHIIKNNELQKIEIKLTQQIDKLNAFNNYLLGLIYKGQEKDQQAEQMFIKALNQFPWLWSAWLELYRINPQALNSIQHHWMKNFFLASYYLENYQCVKSLDLSFGLLCFFKNSTFLINQIAHCFYNNQDFDCALEWFEKLVAMDPYRFENMDTFSNILYIKENQGELATLAINCFNNNKFTSETCCVVGNYYSLMGEHLKAIVFFRKALKLDRNCLAAWTLMGHEYLEMKNIAGAIEAYRSAVEQDPKDFRAWYGLGQTYELQNMNHYALYYFAQAVQSRPRDARMWNALANCYDKMDKKQEAQYCFERAEHFKDKEGIALHMLGKIYSYLGKNEKAFAAFSQNLQRKDEEGIFDKETAECILFLTKYYYQKKEYEQAIIFGRRLLDFNGPQRDEANKIIQTINNLFQN